MPPVRFESTISAGERPQTYALLPRGHWDRRHRNEPDKIKMTHLHKHQALTRNDASASTTNTTKGWFHLAGSRAFTKRPTNHRKTKIKLEIHSKRQRTFPISTAAETVPLTHTSISRDLVSGITRSTLTKCASLIRLLNRGRLSTFHTAETQTLPAIANK